jgi:hypothetical protein
MRVGEAHLLIQRVGNTSPLRGAALPTRFLYLDVSHPFRPGNKLLGSSCRRINLHFPQDDPILIALALNISDTPFSTWNTHISYSSATMAF